MARTLSETTGDTDVKMVSRSLLVEIKTDLYLKGDYQLVFHREQAAYINGIAMSVGPLRTCVRSLSELAGQTVTLPDGTILSIAQVAQGVALFGDKFDFEDETAGS